MNLRFSLTILFKEYITAGLYYSFCQVNFIYIGIRRYFLIEESVRSFPFKSFRTVLQNQDPEIRPQDEKDTVQYIVQDEKNTVQYIVNRICYQNNYFKKYIVFH